MLGVGRADQCDSLRGSQLLWGGPQGGLNEPKLCTLTFGHLPRPAKKCNLKSTFFQFHKQPLDFASAPNFYRPLPPQSVPGLKLPVPHLGTPCVSPRPPPLNPTPYPKALSVLSPPLLWSILEVGPWGRWVQGKDWMGRERGRGGRSEPPSSLVRTLTGILGHDPPHTPLSLIPHPHPPPVWIVYCDSFYVLEKVSTTKGSFVAHPSASWPHPGPPTPPPPPSSCSQASRLSDLLVWPLGE